MADIIPFERRTDVTFVRTICGHADNRETRAVSMPTVKALPFVSRRWWNEYWPESMWADVPTKDLKADHERGKLFAQLTISAMIADQPSSHPRALELIFESIIEDAIRRKAKGGKGSRTMPVAVLGYLSTLAKFIAEHCREA